MSAKHSHAQRTPLVAITGGIGTGKSFVAQLLLEHGIQVYDCDAAAKRLLREDIAIRKAMTQLIGPETYVDGKLQKQQVAAFLLKSEKNKQQINAIVHPAVAKDFLQSGKQWLESAILFESNFYKRVDFQYIICVSAPLEVRLQRICQRDHISIEQAQSWIDRQWPQDDMEAASDFIIHNDGQQDIHQQIKEIIQQINT